MGEAPNHVCYRKYAARKLMYPRAVSTRPVDCASDGECMILDCHREGCANWRTNPQMGCDLVEHIFSPDAIDTRWCGCVAGRCAAFLRNDAGCHGSVIGIDHAGEVRRIGGFWRLGGALRVGNLFGSRLAHVLHEEPRAGAESAIIRPSFI